MFLQVSKNGWPVETPRYIPEIEVAKTAVKDDHFFPRLTKNRLRIARVMCRANIPSLYQTKFT